MWIEVIGLPGVGKTTAIESSITYISKAHRIVKSDDSTLAQKIYAKYLYIFRFKHQINHSKLAQKLAYRASFRLWAQQADKIFFYDSGMLQVVIEHLIDTNFEDADIIAPIMPHLTQAQSLVFFNDYIENIVKREYAREVRRFNLSQQDLIDRYERAHKFIENQIVPHIAYFYVVDASKDAKAQLLNILERSKHEK